MKKFFFPILMSAMLVYGGKVSAQTDKDHAKSVKPLPAGHKPAVAPVTVKPLPPAPAAVKTTTVQTKTVAAPAPITAKPIPVAPRPLPSAAKPAPVQHKPVPVVTKPIPVAKPVVKTTAPARVVPAATTTKTKAKKAVAGKTRKPKASKNVEIVRNEPVYNPAPAYREPEKLNIEQRHEGPTVVEIKDQKIMVNDETVARLNSVKDCIRITVDHKSEINLRPEPKKVECVKERRCCNGKMTRYCYMTEHRCKPTACKHENKPCGPRPTSRPCRYNY